MINDRIRYILATFCCVKVKPQKRLFPNTKMYEVRTWQDTAWQKSFQLSVAQGSSGKSLLVPPIHRRKRDKSVPREAGHNQSWLKLENSKVTFEVCMKRCSVVADALHSLLFCWKTWPKSWRFDCIVRKFWLTSFALSAVAEQLVATWLWFSKLDTSKCNNNLILPFLFPSSAAVPSCSSRDSKS